MDFSRKEAYTFSVKNIKNFGYLRKSEGEMLRYRCT